MPVDAAISLGVPEGVALEATAFTGQTATGAPLSWAIGTLAAGAWGRIEFRMGLISSTESSLSITPQIHAVGAEPQQAEPVTLIVVR